MFSMYSRTCTSTNCMDACCINCNASWYLLVTLARASCSDLESYMNKDNNECVSLSSKADMRFIMGCTASVNTDLILQRNCSRPGWYSSSRRKLMAWKWSLSCRLIPNFGHALEKVLKCSFSIWSICSSFCNLGSFFAKSKLLPTTTISTSSRRS